MVYLPRHYLQKDLYKYICQQFIPGRQEFIFLCRIGKTRMNLKSQQ